MGVGGCVFREYVCSFVGSMRFRRSIVGLSVLVLGVSFRRLFVGSSVLVSGASLVAFFLVSVVLGFVVVSNVVMGVWELEFVRVNCRSVVMSVVTWDAMVARMIVARR